MNRKNLISNHDHFEAKIKDLIEYGLDIIGNEFIKKDIELSKDEKTLFIESILLRSCAFWETFVEKEIIHLVDKSDEKFKEYYNLSAETILNENLIRAIHNSDGYQNFHDIEKIKGKSKKIIKDSENPFLKITPEQIKRIRFIYIIRNYLSHYSYYSKTKLFRSYKEFKNYRKFIEPGEFILNNKGKYFKALLHNFILVSIKMKSIL